MHHDSDSIHLQKKPCTNFDRNQDSLTEKAIEAPFIGNDSISKLEIDKNSSLSMNCNTIPPSALSFLTPEIRNLKTKNENEIETSELGTNEMIENRPTQILVNNIKDSEIKTGLSQSIQAINTHVQYSNGIDVCQRRQTPLRWSKNLLKKKKKIMHFLTTKSFVIRPKLKG